MTYENEDFVLDKKTNQWQMSRAFVLRTNRKLKERAIQRLQREIAEIDRELIVLEILE